MGKDIVHAGFLSRMARLISMRDLLITEPRRHTRSDLAARYGIHERQVDKDLHVLRELVGPGQLRRSRQGYYYPQNDETPGISK